MRKGPWSKFEREERMVGDAMKDRNGGAGGLHPYFDFFLQTGRRLHGFLSNDAVWRDCYIDRGVIESPTGDGILRCLPDAIAAAELEG